MSDRKIVVAGGLSFSAQGSVWAGIVFALLFVAGAFRNVTSVVQPLSDLNNTLLPLWMIGLGVVLIRSTRNPVSASPVR